VVEPAAVTAATGWHAGPHHVRKGIAAMDKKHIASIVFVRCLPAPDVLQNYVFRRASTPSPMESSRPVEKVRSSDVAIGAQLITGGSPGCLEGLPPRIGSTR